ncbi:LuxR C-terminal-related transcriptional regulator [Salinibacterium sp. ZJ77]|uniref:helix-turn-helix transcriptional regulator n=1 Tax=Salinibacterium sp. ZJ77 TaxID=2708337 RepID=UPI00141D9E6E|nr:LuxR C-terminal-related transcriptional regulator [Salinibacterium sp. ZJ77]
MTSETILAIQDDQTTVEAVTEQIDQRVSSGDFAAVVALIEQYPVVAYFGLQPDRFQFVLTQVVAADVDANGIARAFLSVLAGERAQGDSALVLPAGGSAPARRWMLALGTMISLRLRGRAHECRPYLDLLDPFMRLASPVINDGSGWDTLVPLQAGITSMLAGDYKRALDYLTLAQLQPVNPSLPMLTRDAYAKAAVVHALFGIPRRARLMLEYAEGVPRTQSWVEPSIDATLTVARAALSLRDTQRAMTEVDSIMLHNVGEMWPFVSACARRILEHAGRHRALMENTERYEILPFPRVAGCGVQGSVFPLARVSAHVLMGDIDAARAALWEADPDYVGTRMAELHVELRAGRWADAIKVANSLDEERWRGLRQVEASRLAGLSEAYLRMDRFEELDAVLQSAIALEFTGCDLTHFSAAVLEYAERHLANWPQRTQPPTAAIATAGAPEPVLTKRELEVLRMLSTSTPLREIAEHAYISQNTLKTHLRTIYRKLGVPGREAAVLRARAEGWIA